MSCDERDRSPTEAAAPAAADSAAPTGDLRRLTWEGRAGLTEVEVPLAQLDPEVVFGADYAEPIRYDPARKALQYRGPMSHASFVHLSGLSRDRHYQRALEQLFVASAATRRPEKSPAAWLGWSAAAAAVLVLAVAVGLAIKNRQPVEAPARSDQIAVTAAAVKAEGVPVEALPVSNLIDPPVAPLPRAARER